MSRKSSPNWIIKLVLLILPIIMEKVIEFLQDLLDNDDKRKIEDQ